MTRPGHTSLSNRTYVTLQGEIVTKTAMAVLFDDGDRKVWLPFSLCNFDPPEVGPTEATVPEWLAIEKELV